MDTIPVFPTSPQYEIMNCKDTHDTISQYLHSQELLELITSIQIPTCHCYLSICFKNRETMETYCEEDHIIGDTITITFKPDYQRETQIRTYLSISQM